MVGHSLIGNRVGNYEIVQEIGHGGMGRVYLGVQKSIGARVALKVIGAHVADRETTRRFFAEAKAVNLIHHESIVNVLDLTTLHDGSPCIVMEFLDGASLRKLLKSKGAQPLGSLCRALSEILGALDAAHRQDIIHRDIKPDNIFITRLGRAKLLDFGVAKFREGRAARITNPGDLVGTYPYMAPEQLRGEPVDPRTDLFSMGIVLFEASTGKRLFKGNKPTELMSQHESIPRIEELCPTMPPTLRDIVYRALSIDREARFASARDMKEALVAAMSELPGDAFSELGSGAVANTVAMDAVVVEGHDLSSAATPAAPAESNDQEVAVAAAEPGAGRRRGPLLALGGGFLVAVIGLTLALASGRQAGTARATGAPSMGGGDVVTPSALAVKWSDVGGLLEELEVTVSTDHVATQRRRYDAINFDLAVSTTLGRAQAMDALRALEIELQKL